MVGAAQDRDKQALASQAYKINLAKQVISITANGAVGLFYGVETLVQMLKPRDGEMGSCGWPRDKSRTGAICNCARSTGTMPIISTGRRC